MCILYLTEDSDDLSKNNYTGNGEGVTPLKIFILYVSGVPSDIDCAAGRLLRRHVFATCSHVSRYTAGSVMSRCNVTAVQMMACIWFSYLVL